MAARLLVFLGAVALALAIVASAVGILVPIKPYRPVLPGSDYVWMQPGAALAQTTHAQLPEWIPVDWSGILGITPAQSSYTWAQPGAAPTTSAFAQPPAWILGR